MHLSMSSKSTTLFLEYYMIYFFYYKRGGKSMEWTKEQSQAIYEKGSNILVAAAARKW